MRASHNLSTVSVSCDEPNLVSGAGLLPAAVLAQRIGLSELIEQRVRLATHGANGGTKALTVIGSMLLGGDSVADTALLAAGATGELFDQLRAPSTIGSWLRAFKWSGVREFDAVTREVLVRLWAAGAGPGDPTGPLTFDLDSTICPVYGRTKQGAGRGRPGTRPTLVGRSGPMTASQSWVTPSCSMRRTVPPVDVAVQTTKSRTSSSSSAAR
jgi:hypothetical protein